MAVIRSRRVRDAGMGGLVQQPAALGAHRQHPAGRSRGTLLRHAGTPCHGGVTTRAASNSLLVLVVGPSRVLINMSAAVLPPSCLMIL